MAHSAGRWTGAGSVFQAPFRIFFLSSAVAAAILIPVWLALFTQGGGQRMLVQPLLWHQHEMLAGFFYAAVAGFILTAVANWTRTPALHGGALMALWLLWLAGRVAMAVGGDFPLLSSVLDLAFMPVLAGIVAQRVWKVRQYRQTILVVVLMSFWLLDLLFHWTGEARFLHAMVLLAAALIIVIGGRITPAFTTNWLMRVKGPEAGRAMRRYPLLDRLSIASCLLLVLLEALGWQWQWLVAPLALLAALLVLVRLVGWRGWRTVSDPLLFILHVGHVWIVLGFLLKALAALSLVPQTAWLHALGAGAMATMILAVATRVTVAHTGRPLRLLPGAQWAYWAVLVAGVLRVLTALQWVPFQWGIWSAAAAWILAFVVFLLCYAPILCQPSADDTSHVDEAIIRQIRGR